MNQELANVINICSTGTHKKLSNYLIGKSKDKGGFFGTVMLTELFQAIKNKENYLFLVCRGKSEDINDWFFRVFNVQDFLKCCTQLVA